MKEPFNKPGDVSWSMSRIPFGGCAVLDIDQLTRRKNEGVLPKKTVCFFDPNQGDIPKHYLRWQVRKHIRRLGWVTSCVPWAHGIFVPTRSPRARWKRPTFCRTPIMHLVFSYKTSQSANKSTTDHPTR